MTDALLAALVVGTSVVAYLAYALLMTVREIRAALQQLQAVLPDDAADAQAAVTGAANPVRTRFVVTPPTPWDHNPQTSVTMSEADELFARRPPEWRPWSDQIRD